MNSPEHNQESQEYKAAELKSIMNSIAKRPEKFKLFDMIAGFVGELRNKYPDLENYKLYHILAGSTPMEGVELKFDLPDGEIEKFIREKLQE